MALPEMLQKQVESRLRAFCERRVPPHVRDKVFLSFAVRENNVTLYEERRVPLMALESRWIKSPIAQFRFNSDANEWTLFCMYRDERWHKYVYALPSQSFSRLLKKVDEDPSCIFWG
jgi:Protein of unknown function (DUF3024)